MSTVKSAGASRTGSLPRGGADAAASPHAPRPSTVTATRTATGRRRRRSVTAVGRAADDGEALIELHVDLVAVAGGDLDLVVALLVVDLGAGHAAAASRGEGGIAGLLQRIPADGHVRTLGRVRTTGGGGDAGPGRAEDDGRGRGDEELAAGLHDDLLISGTLRRPGCPGGLTAARPVQRPVRTRNDHGPGQRRWAGEAAPGGRRRHPHRRPEAGADGR